MKPRRLPYRQVASTETVEAAPPTLMERLKSILQGDPLINIVVALAITVGFIHGWLKIRYPSPATTFLFDGLMGVALSLTFLRLKKGERLIPPGPIGKALIVFYGVCLAYVLFPSGPPTLVSLASWRGWCYSTLMFALGYHFTRGVNQVKMFFYVLILLGVGTAIYGLRQTAAEVDAMVAQNAVFAERYATSYYVTDKGKELRIFSTFVSSGAFGGTLAYVLIFAVALLTDKRTGKIERALLIVAMIPMAYAMVRSGSRSALISLAFGFAIIAWYRRNLFNFLAVPLLVAIVLKVAMTATGGTTLQRYSTLLDIHQILDRNMIPTQIGWNFIMDGHPIGGGLGRSGYSAPSFLTNRYADTYWEYVLTDGDLGRLMIEMGFVGMFVFGNVLLVSMRVLRSSLELLKDSPLSTIALACASCVVMALASFPSGSPFLGIPMGALVWFFLGTLQRLADDHGLKEPSEPGDQDGRPAVKRKKFRYRRYFNDRHVPG
ncbi:MAG TPA: O-antigen ligase family protein [Roseimicrobium sp.]|nr:O-antigen ligase family protein [Roseimicrobium sp.]